MISKDDAESFYKEKYEKAKKKLQSTFDENLRLNIRKIRVRISSKVEVTVLNDLIAAYQTEAGGWKIEIAKDGMGSNGLSANVLTVQDTGHYTLAFS